jgi:hypothetical protein
MNECERFFRFAGFTSSQSPINLMALGWIVLAVLLVGGNVLAEAPDETTRTWESMQDSVNIGAAPSSQAAAERSLQQLLDSLGYNIDVAHDELGIETFCSPDGFNTATMILEVAGSAVSARSGYYQAGVSSNRFQLFGPSDGPGSSITFTINPSISSIGFYMEPYLTTPTTRWFTQTSLNSDNFDHVWIFPTGNPKQFILAFEDFLGGGDKDYQDLVIKVILDYVAPTLSGCPSNLTLSCTAAIPAPATVTAIADCDPSPVVTYNQITVAGACPQTYRLKRTWTATDKWGGTAQCYQWIDVVDNVAPVLAGCPSNVTVQCNNIPAAATVTATDNCDATPTVAMTQTTTPGTCANKYTITRVWTATDDCGNSTSCSQTITVTDTQAPSITCPPTVTVQCASLVPAANTALVVVSDNCDPAPTVTFVSDVSNHLSCPETITRTYRATDVCGNSATCTQQIVINDTQPPVITCPAPVSVQCIADVPAPNTALVTATDNCDLTPTITFVGDTQSGTCPTTITRTYRAVDDCGNAATGTQTITVNDNTPPVITCPSNTSVLCGGSSNPAQTGYATATDNCTPSGSIVITHSDVVSGGTITRTWTATDACGNHSSCTQTITTSTDTTPPQMTCPSAVTVSCFAAVPAANPSLVAVTDNCDPNPVVVFVNDVQTGSSCPYTITRTYRATDASSNTATCTQTITINDLTPPVLVGCPANVTVECNAIPTAATVTATDNCAGATVTMAEVITAGSCAQAKTITRTWTATDFCGNQATCSQVITVLDRTAPVITASPSPISVQCAANVPAANTALVTATDNCDPAPTVAFVSDVSNGLSCPETITRTYRVTDACGNSATCTQQIVINDTQPPVITCPAPVSVQCIANVPAPNTALVTATDNCGAAPTVTFVSDSQSGSGCPITITRTYRATDACGNQATCTQTITVNDNTPPVITCPSNTSVLCGAPSDPAHTGYATATDNCTPAGSIAITHNDVVSGSTITRTWTATDACGNHSSCTQTITTPPDITPPQMTCPSAVTVSCFAAVPAANPSLVAVTDNCDPNPVVVFVNDVQSGTACPYTITRTYRATDASSNTATCTQTITINDLTPPVLVGCPANVTVECTAIPAVANVTATDNCAGANITFAESVTAGACAQARTITRTWTATDFCGNQASCTQVITVVDHTAPVITASPGAISVQCAANVPAPNPSLVTATDNCDPAPAITFVSDVSNGQSCPETITRTYKAQDACGNAAFATQTITVDDTIAPSLTCPSALAVQCMGAVPNPNPALCVVSDNCDPTPTVVFVSDVPNGSGCPMTITRTYKATDDCGNETFCTQTITVNDQTPPQITCPGAVSLECVGDVPQPNPALCTVTDNCDPNPTVIWVSDVPVGSCPMTITRTYRATDNCGNQATCQQIITVDDQTLPQLVGCPANVTVSCENIPAAAHVTATDNCTNPTVIYAQTTTAGSCTNSYTLTRTWTATDGCGNQAQCQQVITVQDQTPPQITCPPSVTVNCLSEAPTPNPAAVVATDNCDPTPTVTFVSDVQQGTGCPMNILRTYRAVDDCGNAATCTQTITVDDKELPVLVGCPANVTLPCGSTLPPVANVTATDNCGSATVVFAEVITPGNCAYNYIVTRTWTATDVCGNQNSCQQVITVIDNVAPQLTCPPELWAQCIDQIPVPNPHDCVVTDNCDPAPVVTFVSDVFGTQSCPSQIVRTYRAVDACGNQTTCTQIIWLNDTQPPYFTVFPNAEMGNVWQCVPTQVCLPVVAVESCQQGRVVLTVASGPGTISGGQWCFTPTASAAYTVVIRAADTCGNFINQSFNIQFTLDRAPSFTNCPSSATVHWGQTYSIDLNATDLDAGDQLTYSLCPGAPAGASINPTTGMLQFAATAKDICDPSLCVIVKDGCGLADTCSFNLCVNNAPPVITELENQVLCYGYSFEAQATATDADNGPYKFFYLLSGPSGLTVNPNTGAITWPSPTPGAHQVCVMVTDSAAVCSPCSPSNADTSCFSLNVVSLGLVIEKVHEQIQGQYADVSISFLNQGGNWPIGGYDLLIQYDASALSFQKALEGKFFTDCAWEYFTYRFGPSGNCGAGACPSGILRIVALAETTGGNLATHPDCYTNDGVALPGPGSSTATELASMRFLVSDDRTLECQYVPIRFTWYDCADNSLSNVKGDTLFISHFVYEYAGETGDPAVVQWDDITGLDNTMPTITGAPSPECDVSKKYELIRCANFYNGGIDIICADSIDAPGDINLNGISYEIADAVMLSNYFVNGLSAFGAHVDGSVAASDANRDGLTLSVADLVLLIRVVIGDCLPYAKELPTASVSAGYSVKDGVISVSGDVDISGAALVVRGDVTPNLLAAEMDMTFAYDGEYTRILVISPVETRSMHSFRGAFVGGIYGEIVSLEMATSLGASVTAQNVPADYRLEQNYPNPFNPVTTIEFALPEVADYRLTIYNIEGRMVDVFQGRAEAPGVFHVDWNAGDRASGVYLYRLDAGQFSQTRKMLLLK